MNIDSTEALFSANHNIPTIEDGRSIMYVQICSIILPSFMVGIARCARDAAVATGGIKTARIVRSGVGVAMRRSNIVVVVVVVE